MTTKAKNKGGRPEGSGAGRPQFRGVRATRMIAERWIGEHRVMPLEVMLQNMVFYHEEAAALLDKTGVWKSKPKDDRERKERLQLLKALVGCRDKAQACAVDAAPYLHPALKSIELGNKDDKPLRVIIDRGDDKL